MMAFKVRFPLLLLLGVVLLALVCASASATSSHEGREGLPPRHRESGRAHQEGEREEERRYQPRHHKSHEREEQEEDEEEEEERQPHHHRPQHKREEDEGRQPRHQREREEDEEEEDEGQQHYRPRHQREREDDEEEDQQQRDPRRGQEEEDEEREHGAGRRHRRSRQHAGEREEEQRPSRHRGRGREEDEDEEEDRRRPEERERRRRSRESERHRGGRQRRSRESEDDDDEEEGSSTQDRKNPFLLRSNRFQTLLKNENGQIRLLQRFDKRSNLFENLQNYRLLEYRSKPNTLLLPQHYDADFILVVLRGKAILTVVNPKERNSFNLERGDAIKIPAGTLAYLANRDNEEDLRVVDLAIPVNRPGQFQPFYPSSSENQQSYFRGFSKDILEASFNTNIEEIERVLLQEQQQEEQSHGQRRGRKERHQQQEGQDEANNNPIVRVSREQIEELSKNAKSSSKKKSESSKSEPFNLRSRDPIYSNKFGQFFQITPKQSPQLKDLDLYLTSVQINEGALLLPHYNSRGTVILVINEGKGNIELVGVRNEQQQQHQQQEEEEDEEDEDDQRSRQVKRYRARVSPGDVFIIPSSHPVAIKASSNSNLSYVGFGINAENNQRNFLAGEEDNVISQIHKPVKELAFPGSAQDVDKLIKNQKQSYFANAQPEQKEGQKRSRGPLSSILGAFY